MEIYDNYSSPFALCLVLFITAACDGDIRQSTDPILSLSADSISFSVPDEIGNTSSAQLEISNVGSSMVIITELTLVEDDETKEVSLIDAEDWTSEAVNISAGEAKILRLQWSPSNAVSDQGRLNIVSNAGNFVVEFSTPDLDPALRLTSENLGELEATQGTVELNSNQQGAVVSERIQLKSVGLAPLNISNLCFIDSDDSCLSATGGWSRTAIFM